MPGIIGGESTSPVQVDPSTPVGMIRLLITDLDTSDPLFTDAAIERFLTVEGDNVKLAAAALLDVIATSTALLMRKFSTQDMSVDGPAVAASLMKQADRLRAQAATEADSDYGIDVVPLFRFDPPPPWANSYL